MAANQNVPSSSGQPGHDKKRQQLVRVASVTLLVVVGFTIGLYMYYFMFRNATKAPEKALAVPEQQPTVDQRALLAKAVNDQSDEIGLLKKDIVELKAVIAENTQSIAELKGMVDEVKECACKKPAPKQPVKKVAPKPKPAPATVAPQATPAPAVSAPATPAPKAECAPSAPRPAITIPGHMPLGARPSASCPNCK